MPAAARQTADAVDVLSEIAVADDLTSNASAASSLHRRSRTVSVSVLIRRTEANILLYSVCSRVRRSSWRPVQSHAVETQERALTAGDA